MDRLLGSPEWDGYCKHGVYVGGCGIDWMCGRCEDGDIEEDEEEVVQPKD